VWLVIEIRKHGWRASLGVAKPCRRRRRWRCVCSSIFPHVPLCIVCWRQYSDDPIVTKLWKEWEQETDVLLIREEPSATGQPLLKMMRVEFEVSYPGVSTCRGHWGVTCCLHLCESCAVLYSACHRRCTVAVCTFVSRGLGCTRGCCNACALSLLHALHFELSLPCRCQLCPGGRLGWQPAPPHLCRSCVRGHHRQHQGEQDDVGGGRG
jgi:hypothetical protein